MSLLEAEASSVLGTPAGVDSGTGGGEGGSTIDGDGADEGAGRGAGGAASPPVPACTAVAASVVLPSLFRQE